MTARQGTCMTSQPRTTHLRLVHCLALLLGGFVSILPSAACAEEPRLMEVDLAEGKIFGMPVHWGRADAALLSPSGRMHILKTSEILRHRVLNHTYVPLTLSQAKNELQTELGNRFEVQVAGPYVIATPRGQGKRWQSRFISLLGGYQRYFQVRGWQIRAADFPLIVIVFPNRGEFLQYAQREIGALPPKAVGSYFPSSNRCILYQIPGHRGTNWSETEATIVHEAVHQLAYNSGVHERLFQNPLWFVEGLATMFERPAVYELGVERSQVASRVHYGQLRTAAAVLSDPQKLAQDFQNLVGSDELFQRDPHLAYALSWSLTFYLAERMPMQYQRLMRAQASRPFGSYTAASRLADFRKSVGTPLPNLALQVSRFYDELSPGR